jgi:hypothetical protein
MTTHNSADLFTEHFRYDARGRTTAHMQSFGASTGAVEHSRVWGLDYDERGHVAQLTEASGVTASEWESLFATTAALPDGALTVRQTLQTGVTGQPPSRVRYGVSSFGTLLGEEIASTPLWATTEWEDNWTPTRVSGAIMPSAVNGAAVAWDFWTHLCLQLADAVYTAQFSSGLLVSWTRL